MGASGLMARLTEAAYVPKGVDVLHLSIGPEVAGPTFEQLRLAWGALRDRTMNTYRDNPGKRPWAYWAFELGEERPPREDEAVGLAELGDLRPDEVAALREKANEARLRVGTGGELISGGSPGAISLDQRTVDRWERISGALQDADGGHYPEPSD